MILEANFQNLYLDNETITTTPPRGIKERNREMSLWMRNSVNETVLTYWTEITLEFQYAFLDCCLPWLTLYYKSIYQKNPSDTKIGTHLIWTLSVYHVNCAMNFVTKREEIIIHLKGRKLLILYIVIIALSLDHFRCNKMRFFFSHVHFLWNWCNIHRKYCNSFWKLCRQQKQKWEVCSIIAMFFYSFCHKSLC